MNKLVFNDLGQVFFDDGTVLHQFDGTPTNRNRQEPLTDMPVWNVHPACLFDWQENPENYSTCWVVAWVRKDEDYSGVAKFSIGGDLFDIQLWAKAHSFSILPITLMFVSKEIAWKRAQVKI